MVTSESVATLSDGDKQLSGVVVDATLGSTVGQVCS